MSYKEIENFENYIIYEDGRVYNKKYRRFLKPITREKRNNYVVLSADAISSKININKLVANAFIPNPNNYTKIKHLDNNKNNCNKDNLEWNGKGNTEKYITKNGNYIRFRYKNKHNTINKTFKTFQEAVNYRNEYFKNNNINI